MELHNLYAVKVAFLYNGAIRASMKDEIKIAAGVITFRQGKDYLEMLLLNNGDYWGHPKGRVDDGEPLEEAALRELREETELVPFMISLEPIHVSIYRYTKPNRSVHKTVHFYAAIVPTDSTVRIGEEHTEFKWLHPSHGNRLLRLPDLRESLIDALRWVDEHQIEIEKYARNLDLMR